MTKRNRMKRTSLIVLMNNIKLRKLLTREQLHPTAPHRCDGSFAG